MGGSPGEVCNDLWRRWSGGRVGEWTVTYVKRRKGWRMRCALRPFTYVTTHSPTLPLLHLRHSSFSNPSFASPKSQALHLIGGASFSNPYIASPTPQLILQPFRRFTYVTAHSTALPLLHLRHRQLTYVTWRAAHGPIMMFNISMMIL